MKIRETGRAGWLFSRMQVNARLTSKLKSIKELMEAYPGRQLAREGSSLVYSLDPGEPGDHFYLAEFGKDSISLEVHSRSSPVSYIGEATLVMLSLLSLTADKYETDLGSLYPYLLLSISGRRLIGFEHAWKFDAETRSDLVLARRLISLMKENAELDERCRRSEDSLKKVVSKAVEILEKGPYTADEIAERLGLRKEEVAAILKNADREGNPIESGRKLKSVGI